jgi:hypothetical protein
MPWVQRLVLLLIVALLCGFALLRRQQAIAEIPFPIDLLGKGPLATSTICGFGDLEYHDDAPYRWGMGPGSQIGFVSQFAARATLVFKVYSPLIGGQLVRVYVNGKLSFVVDQPEKQTSRDNILQVIVPFQARRGYNTVYFEYKDWNHGTSRPIAGDSRRFALEFLELRIL